MEQSNEDHDIAHSQRMQHDYKKAIQNVSDILVDENKFNMFNENLFLALDEDESGNLELHLVI